MIASFAKGKSIFSILFGETKSFLDIDKEVNKDDKYKKIINTFSKESSIKDHIFYGGEIARPFVKNKEYEFKTGILNDYKSYENTVQKLRKVQEDKKKLEDSILFKTYFNNIISTLEKEVERSNQKASLLLSNAKHYTFFSIIGYLGIIVGSQVYFHFFGFKTHHIIGLISFTFIFIYLQFIGSWYLKQYRYFVDLSSIYIKIKTNWDRYNLIYLTLKEFKADETIKGYEKLLDLLIKDFNFPDSYIHKNPDLGHAKEALETTTKSLINVITNLRGNNNFAEKMI
jgi:hypothetical protein